MFRSARHCIAARILGPGLEAHASTSWCGLDGQEHLPVGAATGKDGEVSPKAACSAVWTTLRHLRQVGSKLITHDLPLVTSVVLISVCFVLIFPDYT